MTRFVVKVSETQGHLLIFLYAIDGGKEVLVCRGVRKGVGQFLLCVLNSKREIKLVCLLLVILSPCTALQVQGVYVGGLFNVVYASSFDRF